MRLLQRGKQRAPALGAQMFPVKVDAAALVGAREYAAPDTQELVGNCISLIVIDKQPVAFQFAGVSTCDNVDGESAVGEAVESRRHAGRQAWRCNTGPHGDEKPQ